MKADGMSAAPVARVRPGNGSMADGRVSWFRSTTTTESNNCLAHCVESNESTGCSLMIVFSFFCCSHELLNWIEFGGIESTDHEHRNRMGWLTKGLVWYERKRDLQEAADVERRRAQFVRECHFVIDRCEWLSGTSNRSTCGRMTHGRTTCYRSRSEFVAVGIWISIFRRGISSLAWEYWYSVKY